MGRGRLPHGRRASALWRPERGVPPWAASLPPSPSSAGDTLRPHPGAASRPDRQKVPRASELRRLGRSASSSQLESAPKTTYQAAWMPRDQLGKVRTRAARWMISADFHYNWRKNAQRQSLPRSAPTLPLPFTWHPIPGSNPLDRLRNVLRSPTGAPIRVTCAPARQHQLAEQLFHSRLASARDPIATPTGEEKQGRLVSWSPSRSYYHSSSMTRSCRLFP